MAEIKIKRHSKTSRAAKLVAQHEAELDKGKKHYAKSDEKLDALLAIANVGEEIEMPDGTIAIISDNFIDPKTGKFRNKAFKPAGISRYSIKRKSQTS